MGSVIRVPTYAKAVNFQVVRAPFLPGLVVIGKRTDIRVVEGEQIPGRGPRLFPTKTSAGWSARWRAFARSSELPLKHSRIFERLGILAPKGCCSTDRPGTGKTLLAPRRRGREPRPLHSPQRP